MRIVVYGLWHLGCVTAACMAAAGNQVVGLDPDAALIAELNAGRAPLHEPGLNELISAELAAGRLRFTTDIADAVAGAEVVWVTFDTPVDAHDQADVESVRVALRMLIEPLRRSAGHPLVLISSQVPVGFTRALAKEAWPAGVRFGYSPENLRLGKAIDVFRHPERVIIGLSDEADLPLARRMFAPFTPNIESMSVESAEMTKHAINAFLALSVAYINELARLCERTGADARQVERGLKSEGRIGPKAYLSPGPAFAGGTLARDVRFLNDFGKRLGIDTPLMHGIVRSNELHKNWLKDHISQAIAQAVAQGAQPVVAVLGLTYKPGTDTLRRSTSVELCQWLAEHGVRVQAFDPAVKGLPGELTSAMIVAPSAAAALKGADVAVVATAWPDFRSLTAEDFLTTMRRARMIDQTYFLADALSGDRRVQYIAVGRAVGAGE